MPHANPPPKRPVRNAFPPAIFGKAAMFERQRLRLAGLLNKKTRILGMQNVVPHVKQWLASHPSTPSKPQLPTQPPLV